MQRCLAVKSVKKEWGHLVMWSMESGRLLMSQGCCMEKEWTIMKGKWEK